MNPAGSTTKEATRQTTPAMARRTDRFDGAVAGHQVRTVSTSTAAVAPNSRFGAHAASIGTHQPPGPKCREHADHRPVDQREHDPDADAVHRAPASCAHGERHGDERHHQCHEGKRDLSVEPDLVIEHVVAAGAELVDVSAELAERHPLGLRRLGDEIVGRFERHVPGLEPIERRDLVGRSERPRPPLLEAPLAGASRSRRWLPGGLGRSTTGSRSRGLRDRTRNTESPFSSRRRGS